MEKERHFGRMADEDGLVMVDINSILRGKVTNCNVLPNRGKKVLKKVPETEVILDSSCEDIEVKDEPKPSIKLYEDLGFDVKIRDFQSELKREIVSMKDEPRIKLDPEERGYNFKISDIRSELKREIYEDESKVVFDFDSSCEILDEEEEFVQGTFLESPDVSFDTNEDISEIKVEFREALVQRVKHHDHKIRAKRLRKTSSFIEESTERNQLSSVPSKKKKPSLTHNSNLTFQEEKNSNSRNQFLFPSDEQHPPHTNQHKRPETPSKVKYLDNHSNPVTQAGDGDVGFKYGELVWAKMPRYPAWPGIIVKEPKSQQFYKMKKLKRKKGGKSVETQFYVLFLNYNEEVAWLSESTISRYQMNLSKKRTKEAVKAMAIADSLFAMSCEERLWRYAEIQDKEMDVNYLKNALYKKKYPKLFMNPIVKVQMIENMLFKSLS